MSDKRDKASVRLGKTNGRFQTSGLIFGARFCRTVFRFLLLKQHYLRPASGCPVSLKPYQQAF